MYPSQEELKNMSPNKARSSMSQGPPPATIGNLPPTSFPDHPGFAARGLHPLYR